MERRELESRVELFAGMLGCCHNLYLWQYDSNYYLISSNCVQEAAMDNLFSTYARRVLAEHPMEDSMPVLLTNAIDMMWITQPLRKDDELQRLFVLGPFFVDDISLRGLEDQLSKMDLTYTLRRAARKFVEELPVLPLSRVFEYAVMLHYCVTGNSIYIGDLHYHDHGMRPAPQGAAEQTDRHGTYEAEQEMLRIVREGDIQNLQMHMNRISMTGSMGKLSNGDPMRQMKNAVITCLILFSRAAMEGGLDPEISYSLSDRYFQSIEACSSIPELTEISRTLQEDYVFRVHQVRSGNLSRQVQLCCDYINMNLEAPLNLSQLAEQTGYAGFYLSRKFKKETGESVSEYIRRARLERASQLLRTTQDDIQKIAAKLQFCSQSRFSECFKAQFGVTPSAYRAGITEQINV